LARKKTSRKKTIPKKNPQRRKHPNNTDAANELGVRWPRKKLSLEEAVELVEDHAQTVFGPDSAIGEIKRHARIHSNDPGEHIRSLLRQSQQIGHVPQTDEYVPAGVMFRDYAFRILPTAHEIKNRIFIPGHRMLPYHSSLVDPLELKFLADGRELEWIRFHGGMQELMQYYSMMGQNEVLFFLTPVRATDAKGNPLFETGALDMSEIYERVNFKAGDQLEVRIQDFRGGVYELSPVNLEMQMLERKSTVELDDRLTELLLKNLGGELPWLPTKALIDAFAEIYMEDNKLPGPFSPFGPFLMKNKKLDLDHFSFFKILVIVPAGESADDFYRDFYESAASPGDGRCETMDDLFHLAGLSLSESLVRAVILDDLDFENEGPEGVLDRMFRNREQIGWSNQHRELFLEFYNELYEELRELHTRLPPSPEISRLRRKIVEILTDHLEFLRKLDYMRVEIDELPQEEMAKLAELDMMLSAMPEVLERPDDDSEPAEFDDLCAQLDAVAAIRTDITRKIEKQIRIKR